MGLGFSIWLIVLGMLAAANLIIAKKPEAQQIIEKISPYEGWIGAIAAVTGAFWFLWSLLHIGWISYGIITMIYWLLFVISTLLMVGLGLLLGLNVIKSFVKKEDVVDILDLVAPKLAPFKGKMGLVALGMGVVTLVFSFLAF